jgi:crotonobetainyl-CoA:carnitine CoA-transferase CaiB-like acyl-CoA transferase
MSATPPHTGGSIHRGPPDLGEDTDTVLRELLDLDDSQLARLHAEKVLA